MTNDNMNASAIQYASINKPWLKFYTKESINSPLPEGSMYDCLKESAKNHLDNYALDYYGTKITFRKMFETVDQYADIFSSVGVKKGEIVSFVTATIPESIISVYAMNKIGAVCNLIDPRMAVEAIEKMIGECKSKVIICLDIAFEKVIKATEKLNIEHIYVQKVAESLPLFKRVALNLKVKTNVTYDDKVVSWKDLLATPVKTDISYPVGDKDAVSVITYTGGTTGIPKGVMYTNFSVNAVAHNFKHSKPAYEVGQSFLGMIPISASYGIVCSCHMPLYMGTRLILIPKFAPEKFGKLVRDFRPNHMLSTPVFYEMLMNSKEVQNLDLSFVYTFGTGGDTMNEGLEKRFTQFMKDHHVPLKFCQGYGLSEMSSALSWCLDSSFKSGSVGIPGIASNVGIFDPETGKELPLNTIGEICATGANMMKGYFNRPEETANVMRKHDDGLVWIHTGDLGFVDEEGFIFIKGRIKRTIPRFDGHKVFPVHIESVISERNDVANCCVIGVNDPRHSQGQMPLALVELMPGCDREKICREIFDECKYRLEERGQIVGVIALDKIPLTGLGKNDYKSLEKEYVNYDFTKTA